MGGIPKHLSMSLSVRLDSDLGAGDAEVLPRVLVSSERGNFLRAAVVAVILHARPIWFAAHGFEA